MANIRPLEQAADLSGKLGHAVILSNSVLSPLNGEYGRASPGFDIIRTCRTRARAEGHALDKEG